MAKDPLNGPAIAARIKADVLRAQSGWFEWNAEHTAGDVDTKVVETAVEVLDAYARGYLEAIDRSWQLPGYGRLLRQIGSEYIKNVEEPIASHYSDRERRGQLLRRIETRFQARYLHWEAEAIDRVQAAGGLSKPDQAQVPAVDANRGQVPKRGPRADYETASRVAAVVARVAPDGDWRSKLDDVCEALDEEQIRYPKTWSKRAYRSWTDCCVAERSLAVKAIEYRLGLAAGQKKATSETLS